MKEAREIWMEHLTLMANNVRKVVNLELLIGGYLVLFMNDDIENLRKLINKPIPSRG